MNVPLKFPLIEFTLVLVIPSQRIVTSRSNGICKSFSINPVKVMFSPATTMLDESVIVIFVCPQIV